MVIWRTIAYSLTRQTGGAGDQTREALGTRLVV